MLVIENSNSKGAVIKLMAYSVISTFGLRRSAYFRLSGGGRAVGKVCSRVTDSLLLKLSNLIILEFECCIRKHP